MKRILSLLVALLTFQLLMAADATTTATITAYNSNGDQVGGTYSTLGAAVTAAGNNGKVCISAGTLVLSSAYSYNTDANITFEGAGMGATVITGKASAYNQTDNGLCASRLNSNNGLSSNFKSIITLLKSCTWRNLTIDGGDCGYTKTTSWFGTSIVSACDFKPLRINGQDTTAAPTSNAPNMYLYNVRIRGPKARTTWMVGTSSNYAHVEAFDCDVEQSPATGYKTIEVTSKSSLKCHNVNVVGQTQGNITYVNGEHCYYKYDVRNDYSVGGIFTLQSATYHSTIRSTLDFYHEAGNSLSVAAPALLAVDEYSGTQTLQAMVNDLSDCDIDICNLTKRQKYDMIGEFHDVLATPSTRSLFESYHVDVASMLTQLETAYGDGSDAAFNAYVLCQPTLNDLIILPNQVVDIPVGGQSCKNLIIKATQGASGQLTGYIANLDIQGDVYFDLCFSDSAAAFNNHIYYGFSVPFEVAYGNNSIRKLLNPEDGTTADALADIRIRRYNGETRADNGANKTAWEIVSSGNLVPGEFYLIEFNSDCDTYRFLKNPLAPLNNMGAISLAPFAATNPLDAGWNGIGNNSLHYVGASTNGDPSYAYAQVLKYGEIAFTTVALSDVTFVVGAPFFVQAGASGEKVFFSNPDLNKPLFAPAANRIGRYTLRLLPFDSDSEDFDDQMFITLSPDAEASYTAGRDLTKMSMGTARKAQLWIDAYNTRLAAFDALAQTEQEIPVAFSAPRDETYLLSMTQDAGETLDLLYNGNLLCRLNDADYILDLPAGTSTGYSLRIGAAKVPTSVQTTATDARARKILRDGQMMIVCGSEVYTAQGMQVR